MIQRISPRLLTVPGREGWGNQRPHDGGAVKKGRNCEEEEEEGISKRQKGEQEP